MSKLSEKDSADIITKVMVAALANNVPEDELSAESRQACAEEFIEFFGRLVEMFTHTQPSPAKAAAVMYFSGNLGMDKASETNAKIALTLVGTMSGLASELRDQHGVQEDRRMFIIGKGQPS